MSFSLSFWTEPHSCHPERSRSEVKDLISAATQLRSVYRPPQPCRVQEILRESHQDDSILQPFTPHEQLYPCTRESFG